MANTKTPSSDPALRETMEALYEARCALYKIVNMESCLVAVAREIAREALPEKWVPLRIVRDDTD